MKKAVIFTVVAGMFFASLAIFVGAAKGAEVTFGRDMWMGVSHSDVMNLQRVLNSDPATLVSSSGAGSPGSETSYFGERTRAAVIRFQKKYGIVPAVGYVGPITRTKLNSMQIAQRDPAQIIRSAASGVRSDDKVCNTALLDSDGYSANRMIDRETCERLNDLYADGKAAGNTGDLYVNRDNLHVNFCNGWAPNPDCPKANKLFIQSDWKITGGGTATVAYPQITLGQASFSGSVSSDGVKHGIVYERYKNQARADEIYSMYTKGNLFVYPALVEDATGATPNIANTPYVISSRQICDCGAGFVRVHDASGSEFPFLELAFAGLAAMKPDVKKSLYENGTLIPTLQALVRYSHKDVDSDADYLTGTAHGSSYTAHYLQNGKILPMYDVGELVDTANSLVLSDAPPVPKLKVLSEDFKDSEKLFDTPSAIARSVSYGAGDRRIEVSTDPGFEYRFVVLKGKADVKQDSFQRNKAAISFASGDTTERIDVGVFVRKQGGKYWSVPGIVSLYIHP